MPIKNVDLTKTRCVMPVMSVGGLASGLDTNSIIAQLTALEQMKVTREEQKKENAQKTLEKFKDLQTRLGNLASKASALETLNKFNVFKSTSNYEDFATVSGKEGATSGKYEIVVKQLAATQKIASKNFEAVNKTMADYGLMNKGDEPIKISLSTSVAAQKADPKKFVEVAITANDTLKDIVNKINSAEGAGVKASIMSMANGENRLILTAVDTGTNGFSLQEDGGTDLLGKLGIIDNSKQRAVSGNTMTILGGGAATLENTFKDLNTVLNRNNFENGDKIGIYLPEENGAGQGGWITFNMFDSNGDARKIGDVLSEINAALKTSGANFTASLNNSGEIILEGDLKNDQNFNSDVLEKVKIQMGTFKKADADLTDDDIIVKKNMGSLTNRDIFANVINEGQNAFYTIDGMSISSQSNDDEKTINGTVFTFKKVSKPEMEPIKVSLDLDKESIVNNITAFIEEYNTLMSFIEENARATVKEETDRATGQKRSKREVGPFTGDSNISGLRDNLKRMVTGVIDELTGNKGNGYSTLNSSASRIGITTERNGSLSIDNEKLTKALDTDFEGVRRLFTVNNFSDTLGFSVGNFNKNSTTGIYKIDVNGDVTMNGQPVKINSITANIITLENGISIETPGLGQEAQVTFVRGIASQIANFVEKAKSSVDGYFKTSENTYQDRIDSIQKRVDELQARVDNYNARISKQFASLEKNMGNLQSQTSNMLSALSTISYQQK